MTKNLKLLREERGLSQEKLGSIIGVSQQSIYKYENSKVEPDIGVMIQMAQFFNVSVDFLIGNTNVRQKIEKTFPYELNEKEVQHLSNYRQLSISSQMVVDCLTKELIDTKREQKRLGAVRK